MACVPPWQMGAVYGAYSALSVKGEVAGILIAEAKNPLLVVGHEAVAVSISKWSYLDHLVKLAKACNIPVVATANLSKVLKDRKLKQVYSIGALELLSKLCEPGWSVNNLGQHDLVVFAGLPYQLLMQMLSALRHFAKGIKTMTLDRFYHANANYSFPNLSEESWQSALSSLLSSIDEFRRKLRLGA